MRTKAVLRDRRFRLVCADRALSGRVVFFRVAGAVLSLCTLVLFLDTCRKLVKMSKLECAAGSALWAFVWRFVQQLTMDLGVTSGMLLEGVLGVFFKQLSLRVSFGTS